MAVDDQGNLYLAGTTVSRNFPVTSGAYHPQYIGVPYVCGTIGGSVMPRPLYCDATDVFVTKLSPAGAVLWSTYAGGTGVDTATSIAIDGKGNVFVAGSTSSTDFPVTANALRKTAAGGFLFELDANGARLLYSTYLPASLPALAISRAGDLYITGVTSSKDFPLLSAIQTRIGECPASDSPNTCNDAFVMRWRALDMTLLASTFLGGSSYDRAAGIALDQSGNVYVVGSTDSPDFPLKNPISFTPYGSKCVTVNGQTPIGCRDGFILKLTGDLKTLVYSTRLGGGDSDFADAVAVDGQGNATVLGSTFSADFPIANAFQPHLSADCDPPACRNGFVAKLNATGSAFVYSTYLGSVQAHSVAVDSQGTAYIVGGTSSVAYPVTPNAIQHCNSHFEYFGGGSGFVSVLAADGRLNYSTFLGGAFTDQILTIAVRGQQVYLGGRAYSVDFPVTPNATQTALRGSNDGFAAVIDFSVSYSGPPRIDPGCVVNGASFLAGSFPAGSIAPGEIVSIFGTGLGPASGAVGKIDPSGMVSKSLAGVTVTFDGVSAPLLWAQDTQVNAIVPFGLAGKTTTQVAVEYQGAMSQKISVPVSASAPGIFALNSSGVGQALAVNPDGSLNGASNPAVRGSVLTFWLTGGGVFTQTYSDGQIAPPVMAPLSATLGAKFGDGYGAPTEVQYSGQAPGLVAGATQVNVVVPMDAPTGPSVPLYVGVGGGFTQGHPAPTVAIQ